MTDSLQTSRHHNFSGNSSQLGCLGTIDDQEWKLGTHEGPMDIIYSFFRVLDLLLLLVQVPSVSRYDFFLVFLLFDVSVHFSYRSPYNTSQTEGCSGQATPHLRFD